MNENPWIEVRNSSGHLLFRYNPYDNSIEMKKGGIVYDLIRLDEIRGNYGIIPSSKSEALDAIEVQSKKV